MPSAAESILVVDDEAGICRLLQAVLADAGYRVKACQRPEEALRALELESFDLVISDVRMPRHSGVDVLKAVKERASDTPVILITAFGTTRAAVEAMRLGTSDYITKPFKNEDIRLAVESVLERRRLALENRRLRHELAARDGFGTLLGVSPGMRDVFRLLAASAETDALLVIEGERGAGREAAARAVHLQSRRAAGPFVAIDCAALPQERAERELFGGFAGNLAGARGDAAGRMTVAERGTLLLKEPESLEDAVAARLARFLQERRLRRTGSVEAAPLDARVILAMGVEAQTPPRASGRAAAFRRFAALRVALPPLRERREDIPLIAAHFLGLAARRLGEERPALSPAASDALKSYAWPGNLRELEEVVAQAAAAAPAGSIGIAALPDIWISGEGLLDGPEPPPFREAKQAVVESFEKTYLLRLLKRAQGNITRAAETADMDRKNLYDLLKKYEIAHRRDPAA